MGDSSLPVFGIEQLPDGNTGTLDGPEGRHAATVRRMRSGENLLLADGRGGLARCEITDVGRDRLDLAVLEVSYEPAPRLRARLAQGLIKGDRGELAVELATEAGVDAVVPWRASRSVARWDDDGPRGAKALARWRNTAAQAAKQARRSWTPVIEEPVNTRQLADVVGRSDSALLLDGSARTSVRSVALPEDGEIVLIVGPEGGVSEDERQTLESAGAQPIRLGSTVLRASTAGAVALGALGVLTNRWARD